MLTFPKQLVAGLGAVALLSAAPSAYAGTRTLTDPAGDSGRATDIRTVTVSYAKRFQVVATYPGSSIEGSTVRYWIDTVARNPGPEFRATVVPNSDSFGLGAIERWGQRRSQPVPCPGLRAHADAYSQRPRTWIRIPAACLGRPGRVAVTVQTSRGRFDDWVRRPHHFPRGVQRF